ncbi:hypothetical protein, conserved [Entamoeba dispar SAW760]|uniref:t-SNARE coiled-coil homology domain-containing protein n=1 Tax=Entamoeba dispar (strain ATCC PRA-260 / SAW760) TaxID=370354 RepID=B0E5D5_ENTDS|nr:uncharacterized protein EDI_203460 [Entamoeba dispar SAW760]EDR30268.1 hypothetical protein, conserved [Entamoeba dispar SAW760]|eukprot:EDR30268.1 hypothetical protein, conserved [Entamoeba dispar SAW760]
MSGYSPEIDDYLTELKTNIKQGNDEIEAMKGTKGDEHNNRYNQTKRRFENARNILSSLKIESRRMEKEGNPKLADFNAEVKRLEGELNAATQKLTKELSTDKKDVNVDDLNADEALGLAVQIQEEDKNHLDNAINQINDAKQIGGTISLQLDQQNEQLDHCIELVDEIDSTLDIANKELNGIARRLATDKIIMVLIIVCVLVIIGCSVLYIFFG